MKNPAGSSTVCKQYMIFATRISAFIKEHSLVSALFILFGVGLLLGDGKQMVIDVYMAAGVLGVFILARYYLKKQRTIPPIQSWAWSGFLLYMCIRTVFSDDVGYSIYSLIRYIEAFLVYYLFVCYSNKNTTRAFSRAVIALSVFALSFAVVLTLFPHILSNLPQMNLLYKTYGHNHAADVVLFGFSVATLMWIQTKLRKYLVLLLVFIAGTMFFFARAVFVFEAMLLNGVFIYLLIRKKYVNKILLIMGSIFAMASLVLVFIPYANLSTVSRIVPSFNKQSLWQDQRWEYWRQSAVAIQKHPWFGSGPGTFFLQSKLYQKEPNAYSWFAHSFPLEVMTEIGLVGVVLAMVVVVSMVRSSKTKLTQMNTALLTAACLVLAQSAFDYNLDYAVVWFLEWAIIGTFFSQTTNTGRIINSPPVVGLSVVVVGVFYIMNMFLLVGQSAFTRSFLYIPLCSYDLSCARQLLSQKYSVGTESSANIDKAVHFFHRRNPEMLTLLAARYQTTGDVEKSDSIYNEALALDPQNNSTFEVYISALLDKQRYDLLFNVAEKMINTISVNPTRDNGYVRAHWERIYRCFNSSTLLWPGGQLTNTYHAKSIYYAGLCLIKNSQYDEARELLRMASDARTSWSNIYLDYAGLSFWRYHDTKAAQQAVEYCKMNHNSRQHCTEYDNQLLPKVSVTDAEAQFVQ